MQLRGRDSVVEKMNRSMDRQLLLSGHGGEFLLQALCFLGAAFMHTSSIAHGQCVESCTAIHTLFGEAGGDQFGWKSNNLGDLNHDGINDFIVTAPFNDAGGINAGRAYVYSGSSGVELFRLTGTVANGQFGRDANRAGDVSGDMIPDVIVGAQWTALHPATNSVPP